MLHSLPHGVLEGPTVLGAALRPESLAVLAPRTFLFVRIVPRVLAGLGSVLPVFPLGAGISSCYSNSACVFDDEASLSVFLRSQKEKVL